MAATACVNATQRPPFWHTPHTVRGPIGSSTESGTRNAVLAVAYGWVLRQANFIAFGVDVNVQLPPKFEDTTGGFFVPNRGETSERAYQTYRLCSATVHMLLTPTRRLLPERGDAAGRCNGSPT